MAAIFDDGAYVALMRSIGEASLQPEAWENVLAHLSLFAGARGVAVIPIRGNSHGLRQTESLDALSDAYVAKGWATRDYRYRSVPKMLTGQVAVDSDFIDYDTLRHEPFYEDYLRPLGFRHFAGLAVRSGDDVWAVTMQRSINDEPYSRKEQARLSSLIAPLQGSLTVTHALAEAYHKGTLDNLDRFGTACVLIDRVGLAAHMNRAAEALLGTALFVRRGFIRLQSQDLTSRLQTEIKKTLAPLATVTKEAPAAPLNLVTPNGLLALEVLRLPETEVAVFGRFRCMLLIHRTGVLKLRNLDALCTMFGLTRQETALVDALTRSLRLKDASRGLNISHETARSQLKSIFDKTGTRSQTELIVLLSELRHLG